MSTATARKGQPMPRDITAGRSAGTPLNLEFDPMGPPDVQRRRPVAGERPRDLTAGRAAGSPQNAELDPMRGTRPAREP